MSDRRNRHFIHAHHHTRHTRACVQPPAHRALRIALETTLGVLGLTLWLLILLFLWTATPAYAGGMEPDKFYAPYSHQLWQQEQIRQEVERQIEQQQYQYQQQDTYTQPQQDTYTFDYGPGLNTGVQWGN